jgi:hypothetical protein
MYEGVEIVGFHGNVRYANVEEIKKMQELTSILQFSKNDLKIPGNC